MTWKAPEVPRDDPPLIAGEREQLAAWLDYHRLTLLTKCAGLTADQLRRRAIAPSKLSLLGLVRHMTDVERWWFRLHAGGQDLPPVYWAEHNDEADFDELGGDPAADIDTFWREVAACREAVRRKQLDDVVPSRGDHPERVRDIRWIYLHMIEEYARHNGHADILREQIDGVTGD
ncbi:MAG TPA: DinB family protein [Streptosporangiaceae bacterium]|jgi:uncharacterized damage-inducible protein DinB